MDILINEVRETKIEEDYSEYDNDDVISVLSSVCHLIDELNIAKFLVVFSSWDSRFEKSDFSYDFSSVVTEIEPLIQFLKEKKGIFELHFYELDRRVYLEFNTGELSFRIFPSIGDEMLVNGMMDATQFEKKLEEMNLHFKQVLVRYFPKACKIFKSNGYLFSE